MNPDRSHVIGCHAGRPPGPTVLCMAGVHGNEAAGVEALRRVLSWLDEHRPSCRGELMGMAGNLSALRRGKRYVSSDLNRIWQPDNIRRISATPFDQLQDEDAELRELLAQMHSITARRRGQMYFCDLHTTSAHSAPFAVINDTLPNRAFARHFPVPVILGLEEHVDGTVADYAHHLGCVTMGFESGRHDDPRSVDLHEAAVWVALVAAGVLAPADVPGLPERRRLLAEASRGLPDYLEIIERYPVMETTCFRMLPGFENFQPVAPGQLLAQDHEAPVTTRQRGLLFMPLYQEMGDDGFFLARPVRPFWLGLSTAMRRMRLDAVLPLLPGVRRHAEMDHAVIVEPRVARFKVNGVLHLLGYRRRAAENGRLVFSRRAEESHQPSAISHQGKSDGEATKWPAGSADG